MRQEMLLSVTLSANIIAIDDLQDAGMVYGEDFAQMAMVQDEFQFETKADLAETVGKTAVDAMRKAGEYYGMNTPISGEFKVGLNWAECHCDLTR